MKQSKAYWPALALFWMLCWGATTALFSQQKTVSGNITDENGLPLPGATVVIKDGDSGASSDFNGNYSINVEEGSTLIFSYLGYDTIERIVGEKDTIDLQLIPSAGELDEVIIVGYGTSTKQTFVGTATQIDSEDLAAKNTTNVTQALAGEVAGVTVINDSGQPGSSSTIRIRGFSSLIGNRDPLYVVDGIPFNGNINSINPSDIESITILKDASATAIYGARGANGVVLITTKKGKAGKSQIEITTEYGSNSRSLPEYQLVDNPEQYVELGWESLKNNAIAKEMDDPTAFANANIFGGSGINSSYNLWDKPGAELIDPATGKFRSGINRKYTPEKWTDYLFNTGKRIESNLRLSGGVEKTTYSTSFGVLDEQGYLINSTYKRFSTRVDVSHEAKEWLKGSLNLGYNDHNSSFVGQESNATSAFWFAYTVPPIYPVFLRDRDGNFVPDPISGGNQYDFGEGGRGFGLGSNPVASTRYDIDQNKIRELNGNTMLEATFLKKFKFLVKYGIQYVAEESDDLGSPLYGFSATSGGLLSKTKVNLFSSTFLKSLSYKNTFGLHTVEGKLFHENQEFDYYYLDTTKTGLAEPFSVENNNAVVNVGSNSYKLDYALESYFGTIDYNYNEKYYLSLVARRDGSSRFLNNKWGTFYSAGASWIASKEDFISDVYWIDFLKLKASYGVIGEQNGAGLYSGYDLYNVNNLNDQPSFAFSTKGNPDLTWESSVQTQIGTEFSLFERIKAEIDLYSKKTDNLFVNKRLGPSIGYRNIASNDGSLINRGLEFNLTTDLIKTNDFKVEFNINGAFLDNEILTMPIDPSTGAPKTIDIVGLFGRSKGHSIFDFYMREFAGVEPDTGRSTWYVNYVDTNNNQSLDSGEAISSLTEYMSNNPNAEILETTTTKYSDATQRYIGKSAIPKMNGAFRLKTEYKGFELVAQFLYQYGAFAYDFNYALLMGNEQPGSDAFHIDILNRWQNSGDITDVPRLSANADTNVNSSSSRFLTSSDYLSLNNLRVGYTFSERLSKKLLLEKLSIWASGDNLWLLSSRDGFNPATSEAGESNFYRYAPFTTMVFGLQLQF